MTDKQKQYEELKDFILSERGEGRLVFRGLPGSFMGAKLDEFVEQPADGILYDLNRDEATTLTFIHEPKWVNDFAVALVIRKLVAQRDEARKAQPAEELPTISANGGERLLVNRGVAMGLKIILDGNVPEGTIEIREDGIDGPGTGRLLGKIINVASV